MALDFLSVPGKQRSFVYIFVTSIDAHIATSTDAERAFSRGHLTVSRLRHSLNEESVRTSTVLGSWANIPDLIPEEDIIDFIKSSSRRPRAAAAVTVSNGPVAGPSGSQNGNVSASSSKPSASRAASSKLSASSSQVTVIELD